MRDQSNRLLPFWAKGVSIPYRMDKLPFRFTARAQNIWIGWQVDEVDIGYWQVLDPFPERARRSLERMVSEDDRSRTFWDYPDLKPDLLSRLKEEFETDQLKIQQLTSTLKESPRKFEASSLVGFFNTHIYAEGLVRFPDSLEASSSKETLVKGLLPSIRPLSEMNYWVAEFSVGSSYELVLLEALSDADLGQPCSIAIWTHGQRTVEFLEKPALRIDPNWPLLSRVIASAQWKFRFHRTYPERDIQRNT
ncbi:MAG: hypothetical protein KA743_08665 [Geothrix sp.]|nr:hypothetical protein [Geothrix sp.]